MHVAHQRKEYKEGRGAGMVELSDTRYIKRKILLLRRASLFGSLCHPAVVHVLRGNYNFLN